MYPTGRSRSFGSAALRLWSMLTRKCYLALVSTPTLSRRTALRDIDLWYPLPLRGALRAADRGNFARDAEITSQERLAMTDSTEGIINIRWNTRRHANIWYTQSNADHPSVGLT